MVLVTGGAGLVGKELITQLIAKGEKIRVIYNKNIPPENNLSLEQVQCSILDVIGLENAMKDVNEVYHCAGLVSFTSGQEEKLYKINIEGTANIVNASLDAGVHKLVHVSSVAALGRLRKDALITENMQWSAATSNSKYGQSKHLGEMEVWRGIAEGLNAVIINPAIILGPGNWESGSTGIFKSAYNEFPWYTDGVSGFVDVRDVARAMILLMKSEISAERFIISASNESYQEIFNRIAVAFNKKPPSKKVTPFIASVVWRIEKFKSQFTHIQPLLTRETAATALAKAYYDNQKLLTYIPNFSYKPLEETIKYTCDSLQQKLNIL